MKSIEYNQLSETEKKIIDESVKIREMAYVPITQFKVGSALISGSEKVYTGCNVELQVLSTTSHAEGVAIDAMIKAGDRGIKKIAVAAAHDEDILPCGLCLQKISEFTSLDIEIYSVNLDDKNNIKTITIYQFSELFKKTFRLK